MGPVSTWVMPGDPKQLVLILEAGEKYYEQARKPIVVFWDTQANRYRLAYISLMNFADARFIEVVRIPK